MAAISGAWLEALKGEFKKPYYKKLFETVNQEYRTRQIFPPADDVFNAFHLTPLNEVKVVNFRAGSIPQRRTGTWTLLLSETGSRHSTVTGEYLSGTA